MIDPACELKPATGGATVTLAPYKPPALVEIDIAIATANIDLGPGPDSFLLADS
jgi:hypothetical protein